MTRWQSSKYLPIAYLAYSMKWCTPTCARRMIFSLDSKLNWINESNTVWFVLDVLKLFLTASKIWFHIFRYVIQIVTFGWTIFGTILAFFVNKKKVLVSINVQKGPDQDGLVWTQSPLSFREGSGYITDPLWKGGGGHIQNCYN